MPGLSRRDFLSLSGRSALLAGSAALVGVRADAIFSRGRRFSTAFWRAVLGIAATPALISLLYEWTTGHMPSNWVRAATGLPLGAIVAWMVLWAAAPRIRAEDQVN